MIPIVKFHTFSMICSFFGYFPLFPSTQLNAIKNASYGYGLRFTDRSVGETAVFIIVDYSIKLSLSSE